MTRMSPMAHGALALAVTLLAAQGTQAAVSEDEAKDLGGKLTAFGAESGANADGSIPAYDGGMKAAEKSGDRYDNPFAGEKPLYSITAKNMAQYDKLLTPGAKEMLKRFPDYRLDVYPTHRTMRYPDWYVENTRKNATTAKLEGKVEGDKIAGAAEDGLPFQGIPFPIPKSGYEVMWNHALRYAPAVTRTHTRNWLVDSGGSRNELPGIDATYLHPWSEETGKLRKQTYDAYFGFNTLLYSPPTQAGTQFLNYYTPDAAAPAPIWIYTPGQRRVRKAPEFAYDIPMSAYSGVLFWDEPWGFEGRMDRFDFKLVGKREMIIPYNDFDLVNKKSEEVLSKQHLNPDAVRWEKHRVWSVEATRKPDARHAYSKRTFEIEEDCWCIVNAESYDNSNALWRVQYLYNFPTSDVGGMNDRAFTVNDLLKGNYVVINVGVGEPGNYVRSYKSQEGLSLRLSPQAVSAGSVR